jgi:hypothetical protein
MRSEVKERNVGKNPNGEIYDSKNDQLSTARANASHFGGPRNHFCHRDRHDEQINDVEYEKVLPHLILDTVAGSKSVGDPTLREADFTGLGPRCGQELDKVGLQITEVGLARTSDGSRHSAPDASSFMDNSTSSANGTLRYPPAGERTRARYSGQ